MSSQTHPYCQCLYYSANALARAVTRMADEAFSSVNLAPSHAFIVMTVNKNPGIHLTELSEIMKLTPSTLTRLVDKLTAGDWLRKHAEGRLVYIYPTKKALDADQSLKTAWYQLYMKLKEKLGEEVTGKITQDVFNAALILEKK